MNIEKQEIVRNLTAILNEIKCMSDSRFKEMFGEGPIRMEFCKYAFSEPIKINTIIQVRKSEVEKD